MSDLQSLVASDYEESYEHAEIMAGFLNQLLPSHPISPSELMHCMPTMLSTNTKNISTTWKSLEAKVSSQR